MLKEILFTVSICLFAFLYTNANTADSSYFSHLSAYDWQPIFSDVEKVLQHEKAKELTKRTLDQSKLADKHYVDGVKKIWKSKNTMLQ